MKASLPEDMTFEHKPLQGERYLWLVGDNSPDRKNRQGRGLEVEICLCLKEQQGGQCGRSRMSKGVNGRRAQKGRGGAG